MYGLNPSTCKCLTMKTVLHFEGKKMEVAEASHFPSAPEGKE
jgi:hypothetical protein